MAVNKSLKESRNCFNIFPTLYNNLCAHIAYSCGILFQFRFLINDAILKSTLPFSDIVHNGAIPHADGESSSMLLLAPPICCLSPCHMPCHAILSIIYTLYVTAFTTYIYLLHYFYMLLFQFHFL